MSTSREERATTWALGRGAPVFTATFWLAAFVRSGLVSVALRNHSFERDARLMGLGSWFEWLYLGLAVIVTCMAGWCAWTWTRRRSESTLMLGMIFLALCASAVPGNDRDPSMAWWAFILNCMLVGLAWLFALFDRLSRREAKQIGV